MRKLRDQLASTSKLTLAVWLIVLPLVGAVNTATQLADHASLGHPLPPWQAAVWEFSSVLVVGALAPAMYWLCARFPLDDHRWRRHWWPHLLATLPFSVVHVGGMVGLRELAYWLMGEAYRFGPLPDALLYEYRKDVLSYGVIVAVIHALRFIEQQPKETASEDRIIDHDRLLLKTAKGPVLLPLDRIDRLEAAGNYVVVHTGEATYEIRSSLKTFLVRLPPQRFVQTHRTHVVATGRIRAIEPGPHGDGMVVLQDGCRVRYSRRFRQRLDAALVASSAQSASANATT